MAKSTEFIWIQRDGTPIRVREMSDRHLLATIRHMRKWSKNYADKENRLTQIGVWDADDAKDAFWFSDDCLLEHHPTWPTLQFERKMRGLEELA